MHGLFKAAEVYLPGVFTTNGRPQNMPSAPVLLQYLQHSTHSPEKDMIWDEEKKKATFKGNAKLACLHTSPNSGYIARVASWRGEGDVLQQLRVYKCARCRGRHNCSGHCCTIPKNTFLDVGNRYLELAYKTCRRNPADENTCNGFNCYRVEKLLPGSYIWFGVAAPSVNEIPEDVFLRQWWKCQSPYGTHSFVSDLQKILLAYKSQIAKGSQVVLHCGGTLLYQKEVCYVTIVTFENDGCHDDLPGVDSSNATNGYAGQCDWSGLLAEGGFEGYPLFTPCSARDDHMVFAFHLPDGMELSLNSEELVGGEPLENDHYWCHRFRHLTGEAGAECEKHESSYHQFLREHVSHQLSSCTCIMF